MQAVIGSITAQEIMKVSKERVRACGIIKVGVASDINYVANFILIVKSF